MTFLHRFRLAARKMFCAALVVSLILPAPPPALAQQPGDFGRALDAVTYDFEDIRERVEDGRLSEKEAEELINEIGNLQSMAQQLAQQMGQVAGRSVGPQLASATGQLTQILTNFDIWACGTMVTALGLKHRQLALAATRASPADPALDRAVQDMGELIARLQELCNKYVYDADLQPDAAAGEAPAPEPVAEPPAPPSMSVQERICYDRCGDLYHAYLRAEREYERARRAAEEARSRASERRQAADRAAERARQAEESEAERERERARLQRIISDPASSSAARAAAAEAYGRIRPITGGPDGPDPAREAEQAAAAAREAEARAATAETRASALYDAMMDIYRAWEACAQSCVEQARHYDGVTVDPLRVFGMMPQTPPRRPPFYRAPPPPPAPAREATPRQASTRIVTTPVALSGGMLHGAVFDEDGQPKEDQRIAVTSPGGARSEVRTGPAGHFALAVPSATGAMSVGLPGAKPSEVNVVGSVPSTTARALPQFVELGRTVTVATPYRTVSLRTAKGLEIELPSSTAVGPGRVGGITSFEIPFLAGTGPMTLRAVGMDGQETVVEAVSYGYLNAWLERDKLRSGQDAEFGFELDFGTGPMTLTGVITTTGPIVYGRVGQPQVIQVDAQGKARLTGSIRALQGSPAGIPFTIEAVFTRPQ
jgi:hypothetical protein